uniref:Uncharacterized protein n=1 Tax=Mucochytrium quahogii TaxID=96639 RepID=A0A7S2RMD4_9STRA|mmetsp:Transcript_10916/g.17886  ORF Transcript_10916/g.17886 Transcript_10916/m.17886 type:complete len:250 (-) Transcript_10916:127-876(-)
MKRPSDADISMPMVVESEPRKKTLNNKRRRTWRPEEDDLLKAAVENARVNVPAKDGNIEKTRIIWSKVAEIVPCRSSKQCRDRFQCLSGSSKKSNKTWTRKEDRLLLVLHQEFQNRWVKIATYFEGRNDNMLKSRYRLLTGQGKTNLADIEAEIASLEYAKGAVSSPRCVGMDFESVGTEELGPLEDPCFSGEDYHRFDDHPFDFEKTPTSHTVMPEVQPHFDFGVQMSLSWEESLFTQMHLPDLTQGL